MDNGLAIGRTVGVVDAALFRPPARSVETTPTELPQRQTVSASAETRPVLNQTTSAETQAVAADSKIKEEVVTNKITRGTVYRVVDEATGEVISQVPTESIVRAQVYARVLQNGASRAEAESAVSLDFQV